jgi:hypothetical protein
MARAAHTFEEETGNRVQFQGYGERSSPNATERNPLVPVRMARRDWRVWIDLVDAILFAVSIRGIPGRRLATFERRSESKSASQIQTRK